MPEVWKLCEADLSSAKTHNINTREAEEGTHTHTLMQPSAPSVFNIAPLRFLYVSGNSPETACSSWLLREFTFICLTAVCSGGITRMLMVCWRAVFAPVQPELSAVLAAKKHFILSTFTRAAKSSKHTHVKGIAINIYL